MTVARTLSLSGIVSANGSPGVGAASGGGSGGSVWLTVGTMQGAGAIYANGGSVSNNVNGGGGGGRIAVYFGTNLFTGVMTAYGGRGANPGGPGSVFLKTNGATFGEIILDNGGVSGYTSFQSGINNVDLAIQGGSILVAPNGGGLGNFRNFFIGSNSCLSMPTNGVSSLLSFNATNLVIQSGGRISVDGDTSVYGGNSGFYLNSTGGGGGNGGIGGMSVSNAAGGPARTDGPIVVAAGGPGGFGFSGPGGKGGGSIRFIATDNVQLDGIISSDGATSTNFNSGGGAGGSIQLTAGSLTGTGSISASGGAANNLGGGGGGGRIVLSLRTNSFTGLITSHGGGGAQYGGAGLVYTSKILTNGTVAAQQIVIDNNGMSGQETLLVSPSGAFDLAVQHGAILTNGVATPVTNGNFFLGSNSVILPWPNSQQTFVVLSNANIEAGATIQGDAVSFLALGLGHTLNSTGGGGGNGGVGGASGAGALGGSVVVRSFPSTFTAPTTNGSRGGGGLMTFGGAGGGSLRMIVSGILQLDGNISMQGGSNVDDVNSGAGAGGSVWLSAGTLTGSGSISVNGGAAAGMGGGGGGGRIALNCNTNHFTGKLTAYGGAGANFGGPGTIYTSSSFSGTGLYTSLLVDNGGEAGRTVVDVEASLTDFKIIGGASLSYTNPADGNPPKFGNLFVGSNCVHISDGYSQIIVQTNATVEAGGIIQAGAGQIIASTANGGSGTAGGGGGHGGYGGTGAVTFSSGNGGTVGDSITFPTSTGGNGGNSSQSGSPGAGGRLVYLTVSGIFRLDGRVVADGGTNPLGTNSGGGAGGSVVIAAGTLQGAGKISADGGAGNQLGGGGGGGRIAIRYNTNLFSGIFSARGGAGSNSGGAGTIYLNSSILGTGAVSRLIVDNGGSHGTNTGLTSAINGVDVTITNGGAVSMGIPGSMTWNSLTIASNAALTLVPNFTALHLAVTSNFNLQAGGTISLNGQGSTAGNGPGRGGSALGSGGGGGHGGYGSAGTNSPGGLSYDSITAPILPGSGGGGSSSTSNSAGGGALQLTVNGTCNLDGTISVNGTGTEVSKTGGGSGGSVWLVAGALSGAGKISADGGSGILTNSGGGAGGRIAVYFDSNAFTGTFSARGGAGVGLAGGAGTIFLKTNSANVGRLIIDNSGWPGTNTPLSSLTQTVDLSIQNGAEADVNAPLTLQNLSVGSGAGFAADPSTVLKLTIMGDAFVETNGTVTASGAGYDAASGAGAGSADASGNGSGGGYGGSGGASLMGAPGGGTYGSSNQPVDFGSGGGMFPAVAGSSQGGGAIRLVVNGTLAVNGNISANGNDAVTNNAGGGAGGGIWVTAQHLSGNGFLTADGGVGQSGGGGGRIAVYAATNSFFGNLAASGGGGASPGQDGTIYVVTNLIVSGSITETNGAGKPGVVLQASGLDSTVTDSNGFYSVPVPPMWNGFIMPMANATVIPSERIYSNLASNALNENFLITSSAAFNLSAGNFNGTNLGFSWYGIYGVTYQPLCSTNLVDWLPYGASFVGSNAPAGIVFPVTNSSQLFFRLGVSY